MGTPSNVLSPKLSWLCYLSADVWVEDSVQAGRAAWWYVPVLNLLTGNLSLLMDSAKALDGGSNLRPTLLVLSSSVWLINLPAGMDS